MMIALVALFVAVCGGVTEPPPFTSSEQDELFAGPLQDLKCSIETVQEANSDQLHAILSDLERRYFQPTYL